eukprot:scaffold4701_cov25-Tisochrysis_lutea.AAC.3
MEAPSSEKATSESWDVRPHSSQTGPLGLDDSSSMLSQAAVAAGHGKGSVPDRTRAAERRD